MNGISTFLREFMYAMHGAPINISILCLDPTVLTFESHNYNDTTYIKMPYIERGPFNTNFSKIEGLRDYIKNSEDTIFHIQFVQYGNFISEIRRIFSLSSIVLTIHYQYWTWEIDGNLYLLEKIIKEKTKPTIQKKYSHLLSLIEEDISYYKECDKIICLSQDTYKLLKETLSIDVEKLEVVPNGLSDSRRKLSLNKRNKLRRKLLLNESEYLILFVGRMEMNKGIDHLIKAFNQALKFNSNIHLIMVGSVAPHCSIFKSKIGSWAKISFTGRLKTDELHELYSIADVGVIPSYAEQCSYVGIEMMMYGLPIIATDGFGVKCMFRNNDNARTVSIGNTNKSIEIQMANALTELLENKDLREGLSRQARETYIRDYTVTKMKEEYLFIYSSLLNK